MADDKMAKPGSTLGPLLAFWGISGSTFYWFAVTQRRQEWYDVMVDYCHHKRTQYNPSMVTKAGHGILRLLKLMPK